MCASIYRESSRFFVFVHFLDICVLVPRPMNGLEHFPRTGRHVAINWAEINRARLPMARLRSIDCFEQSTNDDCITGTVLARIVYLIVYVTWLNHQWLVQSEARKEPRDYFRLSSRLPLTRIVSRRLSPRAWRLNCRALRFKRLSSRLIKSNKFEKLNQLESYNKKFSIRKRENMRGLLESFIVICRVAIKFTSRLIGKYAAIA